MKKLIKSRTVLIFSFILLVLGLLASIPVYNLTNFNDHLDAFSSHIKNGDRDRAERSLEQLKADYNYLVDMKLRYFADNIWFADNTLYQVAVAYLSDDCDRVENLLKANRDDYRAAYFSGLCKYKLFKAAYQRARTSKEKKEILSRASDRMTPDFERCVKEGPGIDKNFNCSYDYDRVSNPEDLQAGFETPPAGPKYILGIPAGKPGDKPGPKNPLGRKPDDGAGSGDLKKGG